MKSLVVAILGLLLVAPAMQASEVQLFNTDVFGHRTSEPVKLLVDHESGAVEPYVVWTDVACGRYHAASTFYRAPARIGDVVAALDKVYAPFKVPGGRLWRVTDEGFSIQVAEEHGGNVIRATYISFKDTPCGRAPEPK